MRQSAKETSNKKAAFPLQEFPFVQGQLLQEQDLAFFFLDIRDFTPLIASRPALEVIYLLQQVFKLFHQAIATHKGTIIETTGDGLYAVFGLEQPLQKATSSAMKAGFSILEQLHQANQSLFEPFFDHTFQVGMGLHVGKGIVGQLGLGTSDNIAVMGYAVNLAARLQQATKLLNNNFIISAQAYRLLANPPIGTCEQITLKGIQEEVKVFLVGEPYSLAAYQQTA